MELCVICSVIELKPENDIRNQRIEGKPVYLVIEELFGLRIDAAIRAQKHLPHKICEQCMRYLIFAHNLRSQVWKIQHLVEAWEANHEAGEVCYDNSNVKTEPEVEFIVDITADDDEPENVNNIAGDEPESTPWDVTVHNEPENAPWNVTANNDEPESTPWDVTVSNDEPESTPWDVTVNNDEPEGTYVDITADDDDQPESMTPTSSYMLPTVVCDAYGNLATTEAYACFFPNCHESFNSKQTLRVHVNHVHGEKRPYGCNKCNQRFSTPNKAQIHEAVHKAGRNFLCNVCQTTFKYNFNARKHVREKHPGALVDSAVLKLHESQPTADQFPYKCKKCPLKFQTERLLRLHLRLHKTKKENFSCRICNTLFKFHLNARKHVVQKHPSCPIDGSIENLSGILKNERPYHCSLCPARFERMGGLKFHQAVHSEGNRFVCKVCNATFKYNFNARKHVREKHPDTAVDGAIEVLSNKVD